MPDRKFTTLRKRLDQLGYRQPLVVESIPLVEKLFSDLVHTTESFKNYKAKAKVPEHKNNEDLSEPYRNDNARLVAENNDLHQQLLNIKEQCEHLKTEAKSTVNKLENENQDLRFLNSQYISKVKSLEKESKEKSEHIMTLEERNVNAVVETPGGKKKGIPSRRQRMDIESTLSHSNVSSATTFSANVSSSQSQDPYLADLLGVADNRIEEMKQEKSTLLSEREDLEKKCKKLKKQVDSREKEISRLHKMLEGGRPADAVLSDVKSKSSNRVVAHLNIQVDYLQQANRDLEKRCAKLQETNDNLSVSIKDLTERNDELCMELAAMDKMYKDLGKEKKRTDEEVDGQIDMLKTECEDKQKQLLDLQANVYNLKKERDSVIEENEQLQASSKNSSIDKENVMELYERSEKEKRRLAEKNAKLTVAERELAMELERVKISKGVLPRKSPSPDAIQFLVRNLEDDRNHYKKELEDLQQLVHKRLVQKSNSFSTVSTTDEKNAMVELMKEERDYYKQEYERLRVSRKIHSPPTKEKDADWSELSRVRRERDELQKMMETFEKHLEQIQENVKGLTTERDNVKLLYEQATDEIQRLRRKQSRSVTPSQKITSILEKAEKERDEALKDVRRARMELQNMKNEVKILQKQYDSEKNEHETKQRNVEDLLDKMEDDNNNLNDRVSSTRNMISTLEDQLSGANKTMRKLNETLHDKETEVSKLKLLLEQSEKTNGELQRKLEEHLTRYGDLKEKHSKLQDRCSSLEEKLTTYKKEIGRLKKVTTSLDRERDELLQEVDDKAERIVRMDDGLRAKEKADSEMKLTLEEMEENLRYKEEELQSKQREIGGFEKHLHSLEEELAGISKAREATVRENKRLLNDLSLMTEENQDLHRQNQEFSAEGQKLKEQIEDYVMHVQRVEDLLSQKELEREELLLQYKTLTNKATILESNVQQSEDENESVKQTLIHSQQEVNYLQERCVSLESQIEQHISNEESYENQMNTLRQSIGNLESQLQTVGEEKETILEDLYAVRELCVRLDQTREELTKQIASKSTQQEKLEEIINSTKAENDLVKTQIQQEKEHAKSLENVIAATREKQYIEKKIHEGGLFDLENVKSDLAKCEREKSQKETENTSLRKQTMLLQEEVVTLRKQLTTEKFERERMKQEMRRKSNSSSPDIQMINQHSEGILLPFSTNGKTITSISLTRNSTDVSNSATRTSRNVSFSPLEDTISSDEDVGKT